MRGHSEELSSQYPSEDFARTYTRNVLAKRPKNFTPTALLLFPSIPFSLLLKSHDLLPNQTLPLFFFLLFLYGSSIPRFAMKQPSSSSSTIPRSAMKQIACWLSSAPKTTPQVRRRFFLGLWQRHPLLSLSCSTSSSLLFDSPVLLRRRDEEVPR